jgi:hypothetical protein
MVRRDGRAASVLPRRPLDAEAFGEQLVQTALTVLDYKLDVSLLLEPAAAAAQLSSQFAGQAGQVMVPSEFGGHERRTLEAALDHPVSAGYGLVANGGGGDRVGLEESCLDSARPGCEDLTGELADGGVIFADELERRGVVVRRRDERPAALRQGGQSCQPVAAMQGEESQAAGPERSPPRLNPPGTEPGAGLCAAVDQIVPLGRC